MELKVINPNYKSLTNEMDCFCLTLQFFFLSGYELIAKSYHVSLTVIPILNDDESVVLRSSQNDEVIFVILRVTFLPRK